MTVPCLRQIQRRQRFVNPFELVLPRWRMDEALVGFPSLLEDGGCAAHPNEGRTAGAAALTLGCTLAVQAPGNPRRCRCPPQNSRQVLVPRLFEALVFGQVSGTSVSAHDVRRVRRPTRAEPTPWPSGLAADAPQLAGRPLFDVPRWQGWPLGRAPAVRAPRTAAAPPPLSGVASAVDCAPEPSRVPAPAAHHSPKGVGSPPDLAAAGATGSEAAAVFRRHRDPHPRGAKCHDRVQAATGKAQRHTAQPSRSQLRRPHFQSWMMVAIGARIPARAVPQAGPGWPRRWASRAAALGGGPTRMASGYQGCSPSSRAAGLARSPGRREHRF